MFKTQDIANYYNVTQNHYEKWWGLNKSYSLHYGLWDSNTKNFHEALANTNITMMKLADIHNTDKVLDAGCGVGGAAVFIHQHSGAEVTGITLSQKQLKTANEMLRNNSISDKVNFKLMDYTQTSFADDSFDIIWACESICHCPNPKKFMDEAYRLLKKDGKLIICDFFKTQTFQVDQNNWLQKWCDTWAVSQLQTSESFKDDLEKIGFKETKVIDYTSNIYKSAKRMYYSFFLGAIPSEIYRLFNPRVSEFARNHYKCGFYQYKALQKNLWKYKIIMSYKG